MKTRVAKLVASYLLVFGLGVGVALITKKNAKSDSFVSFHEEGLHWDASDERLYLVIVENPKMLKSILEVLMQSKNQQKKLWAINALGYDRVYPDNTDIFGKSFRVKMISQALEDSNPTVLLAAIAAIREFTPYEFTEIKPKLDALPPNTLTSEALKNELMGVYQHHSQ